MACNNEIHENDIGTEFQVTITECVDNVETPVDLSSATEKTLILKKPRRLGTKEYKAVFTPFGSGGTGNGSDGKISYFTKDQDLVPTGTYSIQGTVTTPFGRWSSSVDVFKVKRNLT